VSTLLVGCASVRALCTKCTTFACCHMGSFKLTTTNWLSLNWFCIILPILCVCLSSSGESISSNIYIGAGLNLSMANIIAIANNDFWPPDNSAKPSIH